MEAGEEILSEKQAVLFALLEKTREKVRFLTDEEADEVLRALYAANRAVLQRQQQQVKTPTKKLAKMSMGDLLKLVENEHLKKREERSDEPLYKGKPPKKAREMSRPVNKPKDDASATAWDARKFGKVGEILKASDAELMFTAKVAKRGHFGLNTFFLKLEDLKRLLQDKDDQEVLSALSSLKLALSKFEQESHVPENWKQLLQADEE